MAINYYANIGMISSDIEMNQNELQLPVIDNEGTAPSTPVEGQMYFIWISAGLVQLKEPIRS